MTEDKRTLRDLLDARRAQGAAVVGGRLRPDGEGGLAYDRYERRKQQPDDGRQVRPENPSIFDRTDTEGD